jgi:hypothetical protein
LPKPKLSPSALAILLVCAVTCYKGANVIFFLSGADWVEATLAESSAGTFEPARQLGMSFAEYWKNYSGVADRARRLKLTIAVDATEADEAAVETAIAAIAENSPTRDMIWLDLADSRLARDEAIESVLAALRMSSLVGSHEGETMVRRAVFGLEHWGKLPQADRQTVVRDMAETVDSLDQRPTPLQQYRQILNTKSAIDRQEILSALMASGLVSSDLIKALGG